MTRYDPNFDAYAILGVDSEASDEEVEAAFRRAARTWHPDKSPAPDAAERFHEVQQAGEILRDPESRRDYDLRRSQHIGRSYRKQHKPHKPPEPYVPMRPPPTWLAPRVRIHMDAVVLTLETPNSPNSVARFFTALSLVAFGGALWSAEIMLGLLAVVLWALGRVFGVGPQKGKLAWAKITPGRQQAEYHSLDQRSHRYNRLEVPFGRLRVAIIGNTSDNDYRIEIQGFPYKSVPVLLRTRDLEEAKRCAREAGNWLQLPLARAA